MLELSTQVQAANQLEESTSNKASTTTEVKTDDNKLTSDLPKTKEKVRSTSNALEALNKAAENGNETAQEWSTLLASVPTLRQAEKIRDITPEQKKATEDIINAARDPKAIKTEKLIKKKQALLEEVKIVENALKALDTEDAPRELQKEESFEEASKIASEESPTIEGLINEKEKTYTSLNEDRKVKESVVQENFSIIDAVNALEVAEKNGQDAFMEALLAIPDKEMEAVKAEYNKRNEGNAGASLGNVADRNEFNTQASFVINYKLLGEFNAGLFKSVFKEVVKDRSYWDDGNPKVALAMLKSLSNEDLKEISADSQAIVAEHADEEFEKNGYREKIAFQLTRHDKEMVKASLLEVVAKNEITISTSAGVGAPGTLQKTGQIYSQIVEHLKNLNPEDISDDMISIASHDKSFHKLLTSKKYGEKIGSALVEYSSVVSSEVSTSQTDNLAVALEGMSVEEISNLRKILDEKYNFSAFDWLDRINREEVVNKEKLDNNKIYNLLSINRPGFASREEFLTAKPADIRYILNNVQREVAPEFAKEAVKALKEAGI